MPAPRFLIVGGGPAGLAAAIEARLLGATAVVVERCGGAVDKACGEGLMPAGVGHLVRLGVEPPAWATHPFRGVRYIDVSRQPNVVVEAEFTAGAGLGVRRLGLSEALRARAVALGVELLERTEALGFREDAGGVTLETSGGSLRGDWLIAADGLHSQVRKWAKIPTVTGPARRLGVRRHFTGKPWTDLVEVWWTDTVEAYVTPVGPERVGVAFLWGGRGQHGDFDTFLGMFPELAARLGPPESPVRGAGPFDVRVSTQAAGRVLLVGDAAGYVDAITGEGLGLAFAEAHGLIALCVAGRATAWPALWTSITRRHRWITRGLLQIAARPRLRRLVMRGLAASPWAFRFALNHGAGRALLTG